MKCCPASPWWGEAIGADGLLAKSYSLNEGWRHLSVWFSIWYFGGILVMIMVQNIDKGIRSPEISAFAKGTARATTTGDISSELYGD